MKKKLSAPFSLVLALCLILALFSGCSRIVKEIDLDKDEITLTPGEKYRVEYTLFPKNAEDDLEWESDDEDVATVRNGRITAVGAGKCTVTAYANSGIEAEIEVTVLIPVERISLDEWDINLPVNGTYSLTYSFSPSDATFQAEWTSSDESVATVTSSGLVTAVGEGECTITVSAGEDVSDFAYVTVSDRTPEMELAVGYYSLDFASFNDVDGYINDDNTFLCLYSDGTGALYYKGNLYRSFTWWYSIGDAADGIFYTVRTEDGKTEQIFRFGSSSDYAGEVVYDTCDGNSFFFE